MTPPPATTSTIPDASPSSIRIEIAKGPDHVFYPGDKVSGSIFFETRIEQIRSATVELSGTCHTKSPICGLTMGERLINLESHTCLFRREKLLDVESELLEPFEMEFPDHTDTENVPPKRHRLADGSLPLPPSFRVAKEDADYAVGFIQYLISAVVISEPGPLRHRASMELRLDCKDSSLDAFLTPTATFKSNPVSRRCSDWRYETPSFAKRLKRILNPKLTLDPTVTHSPVFVRGEAQTYRLNLESKSSSTDLTAMPVQNLENVKIVLESHTDIAGCKFVGWKRRIQDSQTVHEPTMAMPIQQKMTHLMVKIPEPSTPDFVTYTLQHTHRLKFTATVRIGRKRFPLQSYSPIKIVPRSEHGFFCATHGGASYSELPTSILNSPTGGAMTPSTLYSYCSICRHEEAQRVAKVLMEPIQEDVALGDLHSLASPGPGVNAEGQPRASLEPQPPQERARADDSARPNEKDRHLSVTAAERDRPVTNRSDSAYVSGKESEKSKAASDFHPAPGERAAGKKRASYDQNMESFERMASFGERDKMKSLEYMQPLSKTSTT
ncbi:uncharacterized protein IWZ02DRAFT_440872 [Phyllosticta citriasiana]|uniref:uncharacterized protein n=1 Tax=Phyllosticta citriasiana TaxID=595635 RepID=UPI0030FD6D33